MASGFCHYSKAPRKRIQITERIAGAASAGRISVENAGTDQRQNVAQGGVLRTFRELGPFRCGELPFESIEQPVEHTPLPIVHRDFADSVPKSSLEEHRGKGGLCPFYGTIQAAEEPVHPGRDIESFPSASPPGCRSRGTLLPDLRRHAVEALRAFFGARERQVGDGPRDTAIAIVKRMNGHKPKMGYSWP